MKVLKIKIDDFQANVETLREKKIKCFCRIGSTFEIEFSVPPSQFYGLVEEWNQRKINECVPPLVGGNYHQFGEGLITLSPIWKHEYFVEALSIYCDELGWCPVVIDGKYAPKSSFWDE